MAAASARARTPLSASCAALSAAVVLLLAPDASAVAIREGFEWPWEPACATPGLQAAGCANVAGCAAGRSLFVRRTSAGACHGAEVRFWIGGRSRDHAASPEHAPAGSGAPVAPEPPEPPREITGANDWVAVHVFDPRFARPNDDVFEILSTRERQTSRFGRLQVDLHVPEDVPESGIGEHYLVMHNLDLTAVAPCPPDGPGCETAEDATTSYGGIPGHPGSYRWYGVIAGSFGAGTKTIPYGSVGFAVEVSAQGAGGNHLVEASFLPYSAGGRQDAFPAGWYRISIERALVEGVDTYAYEVARWDESARRWLPIVPDGGARLGRARVTMPFADLVAPIGFELEPGWIGLSAAWLGERREAGHVDWDHLVVDW